MRTIPILLAIPMCLVLCLSEPACGQPPHLSGDKGAKVPCDRNGDPLPAGAIARFGTRRLCQGTLIGNMVFSPDGRLLATTGTDANPEDGRTLVHIWDVSTGKKLPAFGGHQREAQFSLAFTADSKALFSQDGHGSIRLWDIASGKELNRVEGDPGIAIAGFAVAGDGRTLAFDSGHTGVVVVDLRTGKRLMRLGKLRAKEIDKRRDRDQRPNKERGKAVAFQPKDEQPEWPPSGARALSSDGQILLGYRGDAYHLGTRKQLLKSDPDVRGCYFVAGNRIATIHAKQNDLLYTITGVGIWDFTTGQKVRDLPFPISDANADTVAVSHDGKRLAVGSKDAINVLDLQTGKIIRTLGASGEVVHRIAFAPDGEVMATATEYRMRLWNLADGKPVIPSSAEDGGISAIVAGPDGKTVATAHGRTLLVRDLASGKALKVLKAAEKITAVAYSPEGKRLATGEHSGVMRIWGLETAKEHRNWKSENKFSVLSLAFAPDGQRMASINFGDGGMRIWDPATSARLDRWDEGVQLGPQIYSSADGRFLCVSTGNFGCAAAFAMSGDARPLAEGTWRTAFGARAKAVALSRDGRVLAWAGEFGIGQNLLLSDLPSQNGRFRAVAIEPRANTLVFTPDDRGLVVGRDDGSLMLWGLADGSKRTWSADGEGAVTSIAFVPGRPLLISLHAGGNALVWDMGKELDRIRLMKLTPDLCGKHWAGLSAGIDVEAYQSMVAFTAGGTEGTKFLAKQLRTSPLAKSRTFAAMVRSLDSVTEAEREQATRELLDLAEVAVPRLRRLPAGAGPQARMHAAAILKKLDVFRETKGGNPDVEPAFLAAAEAVRATRAVVVLEMLGTVEARATLKSVADETPPNWLSEQAQTSLQRLARRPVVSP